MTVICPCGSNKHYTQCCERWHLGLEHKTVTVETAEQLMRSRYAAYVLNLENYLLATWHSSTRPIELKHDENVKWLGLKVLNNEAGNKDDTEGKVEFVARYKLAGKAVRLHEISRFIKESNQWYYLDGKQLQP